MVRRADLIQLSQIATTFPSRERFLTELTLDPPDASSDRAGVPLRDEDYLVLSTIHSAKGQELGSRYSCSMLLTAAFRREPRYRHDTGTRGGARLLYVGMTRAKDELHLIVPQRFFTHQQAARGDRHVYASRSRFLPNTVLSLFDARAWPAVESRQNPAAPSNTALDVGARMRAMWREPNSGRAIMSVLRGKADIPDPLSNCPLMTHSGHLNTWLSEP